MPNENEARIKGVADVVFVLDASGSMSDVLQGVKDYVGQFVDNIVGDPQSNVKDVRLGLVVHPAGPGGVQWYPFTSDAGVFRSNLMSSPSGGDEYGLPAIDTALDFPWRPRARRYVVCFTDEPVSGGQDVSVQMSKLIELCQKMARLHVHFIGYGPECEAYGGMLGRTPGSAYYVTEHGGLGRADMLSVLQGIGRTISVAVGETELQSAPKNLYRLPGPRPS